MTTNAATFRYLYAFVPFVVLLVAIIIACILGYFLVVMWGDGASLRTIIKKLTQLFLVLSIFPAMHYMKLSRFDLGFSTKEHFLRQLFQGVGIGFVTLFPVFVILFFFQVNVIDKSQPWTLFWISQKVFLELLLALLISFFEEPIFRGVVLIGLSRKIAPRTGIIISAFYYALLHFLDSKSQIPHQALTLYSGFTLMAEAFAHLFNPELLSAFLALFIVGVFLGLLRTNVPASLGLCIGCHASWVWQIKLSKTFFNINPNSNYLFLVNGQEGVIGPLVTSWLLFAITGYFLYRRLKINESGY